MNIFFNKTSVTTKFCYSKLNLIIRLLTRDWYNLKSILSKSGNFNYCSKYKTIMKVKQNILPTITEIKALFVHFPVKPRRLGLENTAFIWNSKISRSLRVDYDSG